MDYGEFARVTLGQCWIFAIPHVSYAETSPLIRRCLDPTLAYIAYTNLISLIYPRSGSGQLSMRVLLGLMTFHPLASLCAMVAALVEAVFFVRLYVRRRKQRVDQHDLEDNAGIRQTGSTSTSDVIELISPRAIDHFLPSESASEHHSEPHRSSTSHTPSAAKPSLSLPILVLSSLAFLLTLLMFCVDVSFVSLARLRLRSVSPSTSSLPAGSHYKVSWGATSWLMFLATLCCGAAWTVVWMHWVRCHKKMG